MEQNIEILFQDDYFVAVNKPSHLLVHAYSECPDSFNLMQMVRDQIGHYLYPLHRLDRPVSGIVIFALQKEAAGKLKEIWNTEKVRKEYLALVRRRIEEPGTFNFDLSNDQKVKQTAITHYSPLEYFGQWNTLVRVSIETGRKHQIRRHFSRRCHQVIGDSAHGKGKINRYFREHYGLSRIFLHGHFFSFHHPITGQQIEINCPLPGELEHVLELLRRQVLNFGHCNSEGIENLSTDKLI